MYDVQLLIDGAWTPGSDGRWSTIVNPATEAQEGRHAMATKDDLARACAAAERGFQLWRRKTALERCKIMRDASALLRARAQDVAESITRENGKTVTEAVGEVHWAADFLDWYSEEGRRSYGRVIPGKVPDVHQFVAREPVGPVLALSPWNWPLVTAARKVSPALAAGCSVILKPAEEAPSAAVALAAALIDAGLPKGVLNLVLGIPSEISRTLIAAPEIRKISFTGSVPVGKMLAAQAAEGLKRITLELGGHAPVIVWDDADLETAVAKIMPIKFRTSGQVCSCPTRFFVHRAVKERFVEIMQDACSKLRLGNGMEPGVNLGPLISARRLDAMSRLVADAASKGARIVSGGKRHGSTGYFFEPTVMDEVPESAALMQEETFGPLVPVTGFDTYQEAVRLANSTRLGLSAYVFTRSLEIANRLSADIESGMVGVNTLLVSMAEAPFGGVKDSGYGQEGGIEGLDAYTVNKFVAQSFV
jgi:succinate-semialdehyde dehydrogenase/glutarate-semialdehyde dehydrogenase